MLVMHPLFDKLSLLDKLSLFDKFSLLDKHPLLDKYPLSDNAPFLDKHPLLDKLSSFNKHPTKTHFAQPRDAKGREVSLKKIPPQRGGGEIETHHYQ